jgi:hypothetical protein
MATQYFPFEAPGSFQYELELEGTPYIFRFDWNNDYKYWNMGILEQDETPIVTSIKLVLDLELIKQYAGRGLPTGELYITRQDQLDKSKLTRLEIGNETFIVYIPESDLT